ncbi:MAG: HD domain-containing protein [Planifilum fulgidum]
MTIEEDLKRRDLTINSVAIEVATGEVVDPFGGVEDIRRGIIRATSEAFREDPLRVYRAARFAARFGFRVEPGTLAMMRDMKEELPALTPERVGLEVIKALETENPSIFFRVLAEADVLDVHFPELDALIGVPQPPEHHPEGDAFEHSMQVLEAMARMTKDPVLRWVAVVHDLGKGVTPKELLPRHHGHEKAGVPLVEALGRRLKLPKRFTRAAKVGAAEHMRAFRIGEMRPGKAVRLLEQVRKTALGVEGLSLLVKADHRGRNNPDAEVPEAEELIRMAEVIFSVTGRDIDANPGPGFAEKLTQARTRKLMAYRA